MPNEEQEQTTLPPDPEGQNDARAEWAMVAVQAFKDETGMDEEELATAISDLLADLAHLCDRHGLDLQGLCRQAHGHYNAETDGQGTQMDFAADWD